ncbi:uncharacterized protein VP01_7324g1, partial [Puccinia sorghi]
QLAGLRARNQKHTYIYNRLETGNIAVGAAAIGRKLCDREHQQRGGRRETEAVVQAEPGAGPEARHDVPGFEEQWCHQCALCCLPIGYESRPPPHNGDCTYIFPSNHLHHPSFIHSSSPFLLSPQGSLTKTQSSMPPSALDLNPVQRPKEQATPPLPQIFLHHFFPRTPDRTG